MLMLLRRLISFYVKEKTPYLNVGIADLSLLFFL